MKPKTTYTLTLVIALLLFTFANYANAMQVIDVRDGDNVTIKISQREITRLKVQNARIEKIRFRDGQLAIESDPARNEAYIRVPQGQMGVPMTRSVSVFITTDTGATFMLLLEPSDIPATAVVLRAKVANGILGEEGTKEGYRGALKSRIVAMANDELSDADVEEIGVPQALWKNTSFTLQRRYKWDSVTGEVYTITNTGKTPMVMLEREFYQPGVLAVAMDRLNLAQNESTRVYVMRRRDPE
jgi:conjugal transfer pilus assembly protein TraK